MLLNTMNPKTDSIKLSDCATTLEEARGVIDRQEALIEQLRKDKARLELYVGILEEHLDLIGLGKAQHIAAQQEATK
jgi:hypothetical protein